MTKFSANLGFLWTDRPLPDAIRAAKAAGFDAVECHWPYDIPVQDMINALSETGLNMLGLNTRPGNTIAGEAGLAALPGRQDDARGAMDEAIAYAQAIGAQNVHVMAGLASGRDAHDVFVGNLRYGCAAAARHGITLLIEPINHYDVPGYLLTTTAQASSIIEEVGTGNLKLMFDCYHVQLMEGDLSHKLETLLPIIGHIQFAAVPDRGPPDHGEVDYAHIFSLIDQIGYSEPLGAEYRPGSDTDASLGWMRR